MGKTKDRKLLRLEAKLNAASDRWNKATARTAALEEDEDRARARRERAEEKEAKRAAAFARARERVMETRAKSLKGLLVKVRARERDYTDDEALEIAILKSLVADIKAIAGGVS